MTDSYEMPIEEGKIREFAVAVRSSNPAHFGRDAVMPPTMLISARLLWEPEALSPLARLDLDPARVLHGEEHYEFFGPLPRAGERLTVTTRIDGRLEKQGRRGGTMRLVVVVNEFRNPAGALVAVQRTTVVETETTAGT
jgi:hypothetical protein